MNTCGFGQKVSAYADGELPIEAVREVEEHLKACALCREELEEYRKLHGELLGSKWPEMTQMGLARVKNTIEREAVMGLRRIRRVAMGLASMAACLALVTTVLGDRQEPSAAAGSAAWERLAVAPTRAADENTDELAVAQWVVADLGGVDRE